jgi:hypothetical protein
LQVRNEDLAPNAVTSDKIADGQGTSADVADGTITCADLAEGTIPEASGGTPDDNSVTSATIADGEVKCADIGDSEVTTQDLANGAVTRDKIANDAIQLVTHKVENIQSVPANSNAVLRARCPAGEILTGGGFAVSSSQFIVFSSSPTTNGLVEEWVVSLFNGGQTINAGLLPYVHR